MPGTTLEGEQHNQVNIINVVIAFCGIEGGCRLSYMTTSRTRQQPVPDCDKSYTPVKPQQICMYDKTKTAQLQEVESVQFTSPKQQSWIDFLCFGNPGIH